MKKYIDAKYLLLTIIFISTLAMVYTVYIQSLSTSKAVELTNVVMHATAVLVNVIVLIGLIVLTIGSNTHKKSAHRLLYIGVNVVVSGLMLSALIVYMYFINSTLLAAQFLNLIERANQ